MSWLGIDIGGTKIDIVLCDDELQVLDALQVSSDAGLGGDRMLDNAITAAHRLAERTQPTQSAVRGVGVAAAGVIDPATGEVGLASSTFPRWSGRSLATELGARFRAPVTVDNDANAFLFGEALAGAATGHPDVLAIAVGTGVGGAIMLRGEIWRGARGMAGEIGHTPGHGDEICTCGAVGHLETIAAGPSIVRRYTARSGERHGVAEIARLAAAGDVVARGVLDDAGAAIGRAVGMAAVLLDCPVVVLGGGVMRSWALMEDACAAALRASTLGGGVGITVRLGELGPRATALGGAALARKAGRR
ncbi:ROK family protein [Pseudonocardia sp. TRM90224]|uniref:ROK family protein n=1 Tax=Pseudonocardia sp. TRM90224 TaxID=2812678 RepID=UPI001E450B7F|nr:ROK family protein [Pseudonocardia sp. TRM90224]